MPSKMSATIAALLVIPILSVAFSRAASADGWICIPDRATGVIFDKGTGSWHEARFGVYGKRYIIRHLTDAERRGWELTLGPQDHSPLQFEFGEVGSHDLEPCIYDHVDKNGNHTLICGLSLAERHIQFSPQTLRFQYVYLVGYVLPGNVEGEDTPYIEIGKCSPI